MFFNKIFSKILKFSLIITLILLITNSGFSIKPEIKIDESAIIEKLSNSKYSIDASGTLEIKNPSQFDTIYEISIPLQLDALIGFNKIDLDNSSKEFSFGFNKIKAQIIKPNATIKVGYKIYGLVTYDITEKTTKKNLSFLQYYAEDFDLASNVVVNVQKANREKGQDDGSGTATYKYETGFENSSDRLVSSSVKNPTEFDYHLKELKIFRTQSSQPHFTNNDIIKTFENITLKPYEQKNLDFIDLDSTDYSVYWVSQKLVIAPIFIINLSHKTIYPSSGSSGGGGGGGTYFKDKDYLMVKKTTDKTLISSSEEFTVTLRVVNLAKRALENINLYDIIPEDHDIKDVSEGVKIQNSSNLEFNIKKIDKYDEFIVSYKLVNTKSIKGVTYLKPASAFYKNKTYFSDGVLIINDLLPDKKLFIQKKVNFIDETFAKITITVKNLGANTLEDLIITDTIDDNAIIKEISQVFEEKGVWNIKYLEAGQEWEVTYLIERNAKIETLPNVFGVENSDVFGTLVFTEEVITVFQEQPKTIEKVGMIVAVGLLVFYLLF